MNWAQLDALWQMAGLVRATLAQFLRQPDLLLVAAAVIYLVYGQYARIASTETRLFGAIRNRPLQQTLHSLLAGLVGGVFATVVFVFIGVPLSGTGVWYLWGLALFLALLHPRFLCFSYAGGLLSLAYLLWGRPHINVAAVTALVAALHLVEALLIATTGAHGATPVYARLRSGQVVGGLLLQRFWPIPFVALIAGLVAPELVGISENIDMPAWWPLIRPGLGAVPGREIVYGVLPVVAALGYSDLALTCRPQVKARHAAGLLVAYSVLLLSLAVAAQHSRSWAWVAALFAALGHEAVIFLGRRRELLGRAAYVPAQGPMVVDVFPGSPAALMGLETGDIILSVNGERVPGKQALAELMQPWIIGVNMIVENCFSGEQRVLTYPGKMPPFGAVLAPEQGEPYFIDPYQSSGLIQRLRRWLRSRVASSQK